MVHHLCFISQIMIGWISMKCGTHFQKFKLEQIQIDSNVTHLEQCSVMCVRRWSERIFPFAVTQLHYDSWDCGATYVVAPVLSLSWKPSPHTMPMGLVPLDVNLSARALRVSAARNRQSDEVLQMFHLFLGPLLPLGWQSLQVSPQICCLKFI